MHVHFSQFYKYSETNRYHLYIQGSYSLVKSGLHAGVKFIFKMYHYFRKEKVPLINWSDIRYSLCHNLREWRMYRNAHY